MWKKLKMWLLRKWQNATVLTCFVHCAVYSCRYVHYQMERWSNTELVVYLKPGESWREHHTGWTLTFNAIDCPNRNYANITVDFCGGQDPPEEQDAHCAQAEGYHQTRVNVTKCGLTCQNWLATSPHSHSLTVEGHGSQGVGDHNYCRRVNSMTSWCYTTDPSVRWQECDICGETTDCSFDSDAGCPCADVDLLDYHGDSNVTVDGIACQAWDSQSPHPHSYTAENFPSADLVGNKCRNPGGWSDCPWCFTSDPYTQWGCCDVCLKSEEVPFVQSILRDIAAEGTVGGDDDGAVAVRHDLQ
eukprot:m.1320509 g.1320509  ORF g.1320509 m.1320509 type:complete len:301 (-) comp24845_c0_seq62:2154-3056(-)